MAFYSFNLLVCFLCVAVPLSVTFFVGASENCNFLVIFELLGSPLDHAEFVCSSIIYDGHQFMQI